MALLSEETLVSLAEVADAALGGAATLAGAAERPEEGAAAGVPPRGPVRARGRPGAAGRAGPAARAISVPATSE
ncbi:hypothetical protein, partial [Streptomyces sp. MBT70]|uniref:hypothetical protein n=1 Tax=Streptomyces sp. MBT70 TaxID=1488400 RepID=UPI001F2CAE33